MLQQKFQIGDLVYHKNNVTKTIIGLVVGIIPSKFVEIEPKIYTIKWSSPQLYREGCGGANETIDEAVFKR